MLAVIGRKAMSWERIVINQLRIGQRLGLLVAVLSALSIGVAVIGAIGQWHASAVLRSVYQDRTVAMQNLTATLGHALKIRGHLLRAVRLAPGAERKLAWSFERAAGLLREQRGAHFDPALVDLFLARLPAAESIWRTWADRVLFKF